MNKKLWGYALNGTAVLAMTPALIYAQSADQSETVEEVVVTGSRIARTDVESISPVNVVSGAEVAKRGYIRLEEILSHVPQLVTEQNDNGRAYVNLRGLGSVRTLVLVNGRRLQPGGFGATAASAAPDPSIVPPALIKSIEILTGGASSVYGADAVAGVVNFIIDDAFEGLSISAGASAFQHNNRNDYMQGLVEARGVTVPIKGPEPYATGNSFDAFQYRTDIAAGTKFDDGAGHVSAYLGWDKSEELIMKDRDYTSCALDSNNQCTGAYVAGMPNIFIPGLGDLTLQPDGSLEPWSGNLSNWGDLLSIRHPAERIRGGAFVNYDINEHIRPYFEFNFMLAEQRNIYDETGIWGVGFNPSCTSPLLSQEQRETVCGPGGLDLGPDDTFEIQIYKRNAEGGAQYWDRKYNSTRAVLGLEGDINNDWTYDVSFSYGRTDSNQFGNNLISRSRYLNAVDVRLDGDGNLVCASGGDCAPYLVLTPDGITQEALDYLRYDSVLLGKADETVFNGYVSGTLPVTIPAADNPIALVLGAEYRDHFFSTTYDDATRSGDITFSTPIENTAGGYDVTEFFAEAVVPLMEDKDFVHNLSAELGYRYSDYNLAGGYDTWKAGISYEPVGQVKFRGAFNRAVRAPNVNELFIPRNTGIWIGIDPCAGAMPEYTQEQCAHTGVTAAQYGSVRPNPVQEYRLLEGGNPNLQPETADTITVGLVSSPFDNMFITVDYWDIEIEDVIGTVNAETALRQCALTGEESLCRLIHRGSDGNLWLDAQSGGGFVETTNGNLGRWHFRGVDFAMDYIHPVGEGDLIFNFNGSLFLEKFHENVVGLAGAQVSCEGVISFNCFPTPEWRHTLAMTYDSRSFWTASVNWRYYGSVDNPGVDTGIDAGISAQNFFDLGATLSVNDRWDIITGMNNVFDEEPPLVSLNLSTNYFNTIDGFYDQYGRYMHVTVRADF